MRSRLRPVLLPALGVLIAIAASAFAAAPARGDVDDFSYASWDTAIELSLDDEGRALMRVTETIVARFPETDQNRGIVRGLVETYNGTPVDPTVLSVRDDQGRDVPSETESDDDVLFLQLGDDTFRRGLTTYVIEYTMRDVTQVPDDADIDEFSWDLLPLDRAQPIESFTASVRFDDALTAAMIGAPSCYQGRSGERAQCEVRTGDDGSFDIAAAGLDAREGVTVAFPFSAGTVVPSPALQPDPVTDVAPYGFAGGGLLAAAAALFAVRALRRRHRAQGRGVIVAEYEVPDDLPPLLAAEVIGGLQTRAKAVPAEIVHLGVRGGLRIEDGEEKPVLTLADPAAAPDPLDARTLTALFGDAGPGSSVDLAEPDDALSSRMTELAGSGRVEARDRGLIRLRRSPIAVAFGVAGILAAGLAIALAIPGLAVGRPAAIAAFVVGIVIGVPVVVASMTAMTRKTVLTAEGALAWEHLQGVREYVRLAEADRIRMLQSYTGAERRGDDSADVIVLYERLLPSAMLFGLEKEWASVLATQYESDDAVPTWYTGVAVSALGSSISTMGSSLSATGIATSSSTSSGSFGGGFSGGGGGGGFSGGR